MDESGHDHKQMPYEMRGGVALHASRVWSFAVGVRDLEIRAFGGHLHDFGSEIKGEKLLSRDRFKWSEQTKKDTDEQFVFSDDVRRDLSKRFLERGKANQDRHKNELEPLPSSRLEMTAFGRSCLLFVDGILDLLETEHASLFISAIPVGAKKRPPGPFPDFLRKDLVFLLERYDSLLKDNEETGLLVMDQVEKASDRRIGRLFSNYHLKTTNGRERAKRLVPVPLFVTQDLSYALQAADICLYAANWGCRWDTRMTGDVRPEVQSRYEAKLKKLRFSGGGFDQARQFRDFGFIYIPE